MEKSRSSKTDSRSPSQEIPRLELSLQNSQNSTAWPSPEPDESSPHLPTLLLLRSILIYSNLSLCLPSGLFKFSERNIYAFLSCHACYMSHPSHRPWFDDPNYILWKIQVAKLLIM